MPPITPLVGCDTFIPDAARSRVLLIRRADNGFWALPGGFHDLNETPATCAIRECLEETGLRVAIARLLGVFSSNCYREVNYPHKGGKYVHILFLAEPLSSDQSPRATSEAREFGWFAEHELPPLSDGHDVRVVLGFRALSDPLVLTHFE
jgi:ADP-ribose pyrophosphatase YjhB (NUDIX family)